MSQYQGIAGYYDQLMNAGYYDHESLSQNIESVLGPRKKILELGIGTGLMAQEMIKRNPELDITGLDFSGAMLEIARDRLPDDVHLVECDVAQLSLETQFEAAVSTGGTWVIIDPDEGLMLGTHLYDRKNDVQGLTKVADHLEPGGLLMLSVHPPHKDYSRPVGDNVVYSQEMGDPVGNNDHFALKKHYSFTKQGETLAEDTVTLGFYKDTVFPELLADAGFAPKGMTDSKKFYVFEKTE